MKLCNIFNDESGVYYIYLLFIKIRPYVYK